MAVFNRRVKMVSFRLSDDEYDQAIEACSAQGIRSVSTLARVATVRSVGELQRPSSSAQSEQLSAEARLQREDRLEARLQDLTHALLGLLSLLGAKAAASNTADAPASHPQPVFTRSTNGPGDSSTAGH